MKLWRVINQNDGNDEFDVEGETYAEAASNALEVLGWSLSGPENNEEEESEPNCEVKNG